MCFDCEMSPTVCAEGLISSRWRSLGWFRNLRRPSVATGKKSQGSWLWRLCLATNSLITLGSLSIIRWVGLLLHTLLLLPYLASSWGPNQREGAETVNRNHETSFRVVFLWYFSWQYRRHRDGIPLSWPLIVSLIFSAIVGFALLFRAGRRAQLIKCLTYSHMDVSLSPTPHCGYCCF